MSKGLLSNTSTSGMVAAAPASGNKGSQRGLRLRLKNHDWQWGLLASLIAAVTSLVPRLFSPTFYYWDDMMQSFLPLWRNLGQEIRAGRFPLMDPDGWVGGNVVAEVGYGIFNPVNIANSIIVSYFDNLSAASYFIIIQFIALLAFGVFMLSRDYGANRPLSLAAAVAIPFSGFTLFYEAARWPGGLIAFAWTTVFWWSARRYAHRHTSPFLPFLLGFMTMTAGNPYGAIGVILVLVALACELILVRHWRRLVPLILVGFAVGLTAVMVYFPLPLSSDVTVRTSSVIINDLFLQPDMSSLLAASTSNYRPRMTTFWGPIENVPSSYLAWFALPLIPWLDFQSIRHRSRHLVSLYIIIGAYFLLTFAPSNVLVFRWPLRLIEYVYLGVIIVLAVMASAGLRTNMWKKRLFFTVAILLFGAYRAWSMVPEGMKVHAFAIALSLALVITAMIAYKRFGMRGLAAIMIVGTIATLGLQSRLYIPNSIVEDRGSPVDAGQLRQATGDYKGNTLQILQIHELSKEEFTSGQFLYGNQILNADIDHSLGRYSGISFTAYAKALCMNYRAETCPEAYERLFEPQLSGFGAPLADLLRLETVVVQRDLIPLPELDIAPGWSLVKSDSARTILQRRSALPYPGTVSWASEGIRVESSATVEPAESVTLADGASAGKIIFARLAWPGYTLKVDGVMQPLKQGPAGLVEVDIPAGAKHVDLTFTTPGLVAGLAAQGVAWAGMAAMTAVYYVRRRRSPEFVRRAGSIV
ncbi:hypothetical protein NFC73_02790 [Pseudarthrobacter sp. RMG13]|uniref:YfhO family protein n=1 Tax=Pseudarthrobacter humi TaxID=2952523 RepID=A0ABT1LJQ2_9MICC|nr:hypothetical protein [Pseudarthrobacter humi]MCP8998665.1 hypothetical protein [Pseudarthrobacter humi]